jgi:hypothetical protein
MMMIIEEDRDTTPDASRGLLHVVSTIPNALFDQQCKFSSSQYIFCHDLLW